jgi:hypothetical protein
MLFLSGAETKLDITTDEADEAGVAATEVFSIDDPSEGQEATWHPLRDVGSEVLGSSKTMPML